MEDSIEMLLYVAIMNNDGVNDHEEDDNYDAMIWWRCCYYWLWSWWLCLGRNITILSLQMDVLCYVEWVE
jgi:hypothetical protein